MLSQFFRAAAARVLPPGAAAAFCRVAAIPAPAAPAEAPAVVAPAVPQEATAEAPAAAPAVASPPALGLAAVAQPAPGAGSPVLGGAEGGVTPVASALERTARRLLWGDAGEAVSDAEAVLICTEIDSSDRVGARPGDPPGPWLPPYDPAPQPSPRLPPSGRPWPGGASVVPEPAVIRQSAALTGAAFAGSQVWAAMAATWAAQQAETNAERERIASGFRARTWAARFMDEHSEWFAPNPSGSRTPDQFHVGLWFLPEVRRLALAHLGWAAPITDYYPWLAWADSLAPVADVPGYCYVHLLPAWADRRLAALTLGAWPEAHRITAWFQSRGLPMPAAFRYSSRPDGFGHVHAADEPGGELRCLPGSYGAAESIPEETLLGGDPPDANYRVRIVLTTDAAFKLEVAAIPSVAALSRVWPSVRLLRVCPTLTASSDGSMLRVGLSGEPGRDDVPLGACSPADALFADAHMVADRITAEAGLAPRSLAPPETVDPELSRHAAALRPRPDLTIEFVADEGAAAAVELVFAVSGCALVRHRDAECVPPGLAIAAEETAANT